MKNKNYEVIQGIKCTDTSTQDQCSRLKDCFTDRIDPITQAAAGLPQ
jgi:hypothetical protein